MATPGPAAIAAANPEARDVFDRQVAMMVRLAHRGALVAVAGVSLLATILVPEAGWARFSLWAGLVLGALATRTGALLFIARRKAPVTTARRAERVLTLTTAVLGLCVASGAFFFYPVTGFEVRALVTLILCAWPAAGAAVLGAHPRSFLWYLGCYFLTLGLAWLTYEPGYPAVFVLMLLFGAMLGLLAREIGRLVLASVALEREKDRLLVDKDALIAEKDTLIGELDAAKVRAEEADMYKSRFLAAASHDLRQPVTALALLAGALAHTTLEPKGREIARQIVQSLDSLEALFTAILDLSKLDAGAVSVSPSAVAVASLFADLHREFAARFAAKGVALRVRPDATWLVVDRVLLERIVRNLLDNALKYTDKGVVSLSTRTRGTRFSLVVRDTGPGIAVAEHERIFTDFYQLSRTSQTRDAGLGLGLAIVRRLARVLGVTIAVHSRLRSANSRIPRGTTFTIELPAAMRIAAPPSPAPPAPPTAFDLRHRLITVIDDNEAVRSAFAVALERWGADAIVTDTQDDALLRVAATGRAPDLVIADYHLAGTARGTEAIAAFRRRYPDVPALVMTGDGDIDALRATGMEVLQKPIAYGPLGSRLAAQFGASVTPRERDREWHDSPNPSMR